MRLRIKQTGEVVEGFVQVVIQNNDKFPNPLEYHTLMTIAELNEDWEDYKPTELEIADETARETIRKWYNKNRIVGKLRSYGGGSWLGLRGDDKSGCSWRIELCVDYSSKLISGKLYSLNELCGSEE